MQILVQWRQQLEPNLVQAVDEVLILGELRKLAHGSYVEVLHVARLNILKRVNCASTPMSGPNSHYKSQWLSTTAHPGNYNAALVVLQCITI